MKNNKKSVFVCQTCGYAAPKWMGKCTECNSWNTLVEEVASAESEGVANIFYKPGQVMKVRDIEITQEHRLRSGIGEFDRVLGGGIVSGSLILIGGDPGIGKSTLMLQAFNELARQGQAVLYVSGEESPQQIKIRNMRLELPARDLLILSETNLDCILKAVAANRPDVLVIDSIQTMFCPNLASAPGSVSQVREATLQLMTVAKKSGLPIFLIGHVTKDGAIAGPKVMEHMVDTVLYFVGDHNGAFRTLRANKNRYGSTNEIGVFEMKANGLQEVTNPSKFFLAERPTHASGSIVTASLEGTRPILIELQGLVSASNLGTPRRTILGLDHSRVALLVAVMEKKLGMQLAGLDIFMNIAGGLKINEPAVDLAVIASIASSLLDKPISEGIVVLGEVGLTGEVRRISQIDSRLSEIAKMGFKHCLLPAACLDHVLEQKNVKTVGIRRVAEAIEYLF